MVCVSMELLSEAKAVKIRSHIDKYLIADDDQETVRQSRNGSLKRAIWTVEIVGSKNNVIRLKSCYGKYLTASDQPFLLGMTGKKVIQSLPENKLDMNFDWEPVRDGFQLRLKTWCGTFLRGNGGTPPWRNSVTHDEPHTGSTKNWVLWDLETVDVSETGSFDEYLSSMSSLSSVSDGVLEALSDGVPGSGPDSPMSVVSPIKSSSRLSVFSFKSNRLFSNKTVSYSAAGKGTTAMDFFQNAKAVRLRSHHDKYLVAHDDEESVTQDRNGSSKNARWMVELVPNASNIVRLKSVYGNYLTASNQPYLLGMTGRKVVLSLPKRLDSSLEWEPIREGNQIKLKTRYGHFLRANGGLPPWRNSVTHDIPHRTSTQEWILWNVDVVEILVQSPAGSQKAPIIPPPSIQHTTSLDFESNSPTSRPAKSTQFARQESNDSYVGSPPKSEGRTIFYHLADENGEVDDDATEMSSFSFKGNGVEELTLRLKEELGLDDIVVCTRSPLNGNLYPLRLQLPPNNADIHVVVVPSSAQVARDFAKQGTAL